MAKGRGKSVSGTNSIDKAVGQRGRSRSEIASGLFRLGNREVPKVGKRKCPA